jgi:hypothetical protein
VNQRALISRLLRANDRRKRLGAATPLLQRGAFASPASNILPGSGSQFHRNETARQCIYAEARLSLPSVGMFGNRARSGATAMRTAKRDSPCAQCVHECVIAVHLRVFHGLRGNILHSRRGRVCSILHRLRVVNGSNLGCKMERSNRRAGHRAFRRGAQLGSAM